MNSQKYNVFSKSERDIDKNMFAELLVRAKGDRTMKDFALACGVQPSTFTRIIQKQNKGGSSPALLERIAENAARGSGVTIEMLAHANGYEVKGKDSAFAQQCKENGKQACTIITKELLQRDIRGSSNGSDRMPVIKSRLPQPLCVDMTMDTNAFGGKILAVDYMNLREIRRDTVFSVLRRLGMFALTAANSHEKKPIRFLLTVSEPALYAQIKDRFEETLSPAEVSVVLVDLEKDEVADEFVFLNEENTRPAPVFMSVPMEAVTYYIKMDDICYAKEKGEF